MVVRLTGAEDVIASSPIHIVMTAQVVVGTEECSHEFGAGP